MLACAPEIQDSPLGVCRELIPSSGKAAITRVSGLIVARYLGDSSEAAKQYFTRLWTVLRPAMLGRDAAEPRIWRT
jgi:urease accessory protein